MYWFDENVRYDVDFNKSWENDDIKMIVQNLPKNEDISNIDVFGKFTDIMMIMKTDEINEKLKK